MEVCGRGAEVGGPDLGPPCGCGKPASRRAAAMTELVWAPTSLALTTQAVQARTKLAGIGQMSDGTRGRPSRLWVRAGLSK